MKPARRFPSLGSALLGALLLATASGRAGSLSSFDNDEVTGYRIQNYRSPVNRAVESGTRVEIADVDRLGQEGALLIDVMPQRGGYDPATGAWRIVDRRATIPGAVWLPNTGAGKLDGRTAAYLAGQLALLTQGDKAKPLIFFCMADCWMSWNAVKRASELGYRHVYWFADGTDGWNELDRPLVEAVPPRVPALE